MATGTDFILDALLREGLDHLFMVPGGLVDPFLPALARHPGLKPIVAAHEGGAAYMAAFNYPHLAEWFEERHKVLRHRNRP